MDLVLVSVVYVLKIVLQSYNLFQNKKLMI